MLTNVIFTTHIVFAVEQDSLSAIKLFSLARRTYLWATLLFTLLFHRSQFKSHVAILVYV